MKYIIYICHPAKKEKALALFKDAGIFRVMCSEVDGYGTSAPRNISYRGEKVTVNHHRRLKIEVAVTDDMLGKVYEIADGLAEGETSGAGKLFVLPLEETYKPRTKAKGNEAI